MANYIIGNQMNTATSHRACDSIIAVKCFGYSLYSKPHAAPATRAAIVSMKLHEPACTSAYMSVVTTKPMLGVQRSDSVCCTYPRQKISSAGPMRNNMSAVSNHGDSPSFIEYMVSTCGRAKSKNICDNLSPIQNMPHNATAMAMPSMISVGVIRMQFHHFGLNIVAHIESVQADPVIIHQKLTWGAVHGLNIIVQSTVASNMVKTRRFILPMCR